MSQATATAGQAPVPPTAPAAGVVSPNPAPVNVTPQGDTSGAAAATWTAGLSPELQGYIQNKGFKGPQDLADSYRNLEKLHGVPAERMLKLPESMESPEARAVWERLGAPKEAKDYAIDVKKFGGDAETASMMGQTFFDAGIPKAAADKIVNKLAEYGDARTAARGKQMQDAIQSGEANLKNEWGAAFEQNKQLAKSASVALGLDAKQIDGLASVLGHEATLKLMHKLGSSVREDVFVQGKPAGGILAPSAAIQQRTDLMRDQAFVQRYLSGDAEANAKMTALNQMISPGDVSI